MSREEMVKCSRRQVENRPSGRQLRCLSKDSEFHLQVVLLDTCAGCPVRQGPPIQEPATASLPVLGGFKPCNLRLGTTCSANGFQVTPESCDRCIGESAAEEAGLGQKFKNYAMAVRRWVANGKPVRSQEEIDRLFEEHCSKCEMFEDGVCRSCGCSVSSGDFPLTNKLAMKTEVCPMGRWA